MLGRPLIKYPTVQSDNIFTHGEKLTVNRQAALVAGCLVAARQRFKPTVPHWPLNF
jgi:hypothetical protein